MISIALRFASIAKIAAAIAVAFAGASAVPAQDYAPQKQLPWAGVWGIWKGEVYSRETYPWYLGTMIRHKWPEIEPDVDRFDFSAMDEKIAQSIANGLLISIIIDISPDPPEWLNTKLGVDFFQTTAKLGWAPDAKYPWYFDPAFEDAFRKMIVATADHIDSLAPEIREKIVAIGAQVGKSGDPQPYDGKPYDPKYEIGIRSPEWLQYNRRMFQFYYDTYKDRTPEIVVIIKPTAENEEYSFANMPRAGRKAFSMAQGYHLSAELKQFFARDAIEKGLPLFRGEFDRGIRDKSAWFIAAPLWNTYWTALWCLTYKLDMWNVRSQMMDEAELYAPALEFFTVWAGYKKAQTSLGAWIAFRDDLDCADTKRFPESRYGACQQGANPARFDAIAREFAPWGARQDDPEGTHLKGLEVVKNQKGLNDVQWDVWRGNYGMYMKQIRANETSQGYWRVGSKDQMYGRFARGFDHAQKKNAIYLDIDDGLFGAEPLSGRSPVSVRVVYFDKGTGAWQLRYDSTSEPDKLAREVTNTDSGLWKELTLDLADAHFDNRGPMESDLWLANSDEQNEIFHMVEIRKTAK